MTLGLGFSFGFGASRGGGSGGGASTAAIISTNLTARYVSSAAADFSLTGAAVNTWGEHSGNADLAITYVSDTKVNRDTTHPINTTGATVDTANASCLYKTPAGGTLSDYFPSGVGTVYIVFYADSHPDAFSAPDWIFFAGTECRLAIVDGPNLRFDTNAGGQSISGSLTLDAWHVAVVRFSAGAGNLKLRIDDTDITPVAGAACDTLTDRLQFFYDAGDAGRFDGAIADMLFYSASHSDADVTTNITALRDLYADI